MNKTNQTIYEPIIASPVKSFFVSWLTRDISLEDSILDLLDNCVDGILRSQNKKDGPRPYEGFRAEIEFKKDLFSISDNCGGIPWSMHSYAFRMGRAVTQEPDASGTVGVYGIGMKRAIFKMGKYCLISTQNSTDRYEIEISPDWFKDEDDWDLPVNVARRSMKEDGTTLIIGNLNSGIKEQFGEDVDNFTSRLRSLISTHYAFIIAKGFQVKINKQIVELHSTKFIFEDTPAIDGMPAMQPYIFKTITKDGVEVLLTVGFTRPIPSQSEIDAEQEAQYSSEEAGWTVICNDRAVLSCDKTILTGWGDSGVPRYHTQFIAISGIVEFRADDPRKLPTTTTKRGLDASSPVYQQIKNKMREGMRIFTNYTNKWKGHVEESKKLMQDKPILSLSEIRTLTATNRIKFHSTIRSFPPGEQFMPPLPMPKRIEPTKKKITFIKEENDIKLVAGYLDMSYATPNEIGEACFNTVLEEAKK
jgi:hypothetical protein